MPLASTTSTDSDSASIELPDSGIVLDTWTSYRISSDFLEPSDDWEFTLAHEGDVRELLRHLSPGAACVVKINQTLQATGYIDEVEVSNTRDGGTEIRVLGRDRVAPVVDSCIDPTEQFTENSTLEQVLSRIFLELHGFESLAITNEGNRGVLTGQTRGVKTSKKGKPLKSYVLHQLKPYPHEGAFEFAARIAQRHALWIWPSADGQGIVVSTPDFDQPVSYSLFRSPSSANKDNILGGSYRISGRSQPTLIIATGFGGGGEWAHSGLKAAIVNELTGLDDDGFPTPEVRATLDRHPDAAIVNDTQPGLGLFRTPFEKRLRMARTMHRPLFLHDDESKTPEQLEHYVRREMALHQRRAYSTNYLVRGHSQNGVVWAVDTMVHVEDERAGLRSPMYVLGRTFTKDRAGGTHTQLHLILPYTLVFS